MTENTLDKYFASTPAKSVKRHRPYSSPETGSEDPAVSMSGEKVGDMTADQLMAGLGQLMDQKLASLTANLATKDDFESMAGQVAALVEENKALKNEVSLLQGQVKLANDKLVDLEGRSRRNNLIFRGLKWRPNEKDFRQLVGNFCSEHLGCEDRRLWVNRAHPLGRSGDTVIAHFPSDSDVECIMSRAKQLKGTGYFVFRDYPQEVRDKRSYLMAVRAEVVRVSGARRMPIVFDHMDIERERFTWVDGVLKAGRQDGGEKLKNIFRHDFTEFLARLKQQGVEQRPRRRAPSEPTPNLKEMATGDAGAESTEKLRQKSQQGLHQTTVAGGTPTYANVSSQH